MTTEESARRAHYRSAARLKGKINTLLAAGPGLGVHRPLYRWFPVLPCLLTENGFCKAVSALLSAGHGLILPAGSCHNKNWCLSSQGWPATFPFSPVLCPRGPGALPRPGRMEAAAPGRGRRWPEALPEALQLSLGLWRRARSSGKGPEQPPVPAASADSRPAHHDRQSKPLDRQLPFPCRHGKGLVYLMAARGDRVGFSIVFYLGAPQVPAPRSLHGGRQWLRGRRHLLGCGTRAGERRGMRLGEQWRWGAKGRLY